jgi:hypothetical protein
MSRKDRKYGKGEIERKNHHNNEDREWLCLEGGLLWFLPGIDSSLTHRIERRSKDLVKGSLFLSFSLQEKGRTSLREKTRERERETENAVNMTRIKAFTLL